MGTIKSFYADGENQKIYTDSTLTEDFPANSAVVGGRFETVDNEIDLLNGKIHLVSDNKYNPDLQTSETISPHYFVNGVPYSSTQFDNSWNCTALFPIEASTQYTIGLVPDVSTYTKPWGRATSGIFFYDANGNYLSGTDSSTFTTPSNATQARFNYNIDNGITLAQVNARCVLIKGDTLPDSFIPFEDQWINEKVERIKSGIASAMPPINYIIDANGNGITLISKYDSSHDIAVYMAKKGGNNLFDFSTVGLISNTEDSIKEDTSGIAYLLSSTGDWFAPYKVAAVSNVDGDNPTSEYFTGGNHQYNDRESGSTSTARTSSLAFYIDNKLKSSGSGSAKIIEIVWTNYIQGYNTTKSDGTGREILKEVHKVVFNGREFVVDVDVIPLENITIKTWYGFQWFTTPYKYTRFVGGTHRQQYDVSSENASSGDANCCFVIGYDDGNEINVSIDPAYDLGKRSYYSGTEAVFTRYSYSKGYFNIIKDLNASEDDVYSLRGRYAFISHH